MKCFDLQVNGAFGLDFSDCNMTADSFLRTAEKIFAAGVTRFLPTIITSPMDLYRRNLPMILEAVDHAGLNYEIPGFHLEGPFISPEPGAVGAHDPAATLTPSPANLAELNQIADGKILLLTLAAERDGALETINAAKQAGITVSLGHQLAERTHLQAAADAGATLLTHLGNGIPNMIHRHHNPIWSGLANEQLTAMIITDGHHLPADVIKCMIRSKTSDKIIVTSDASSAAGLPPGNYSVLGNDAVLYENGLLWNPEKQCLVGSGSLMPQCIEYLQSLNLLSTEELTQVVWENPHRMLSLPY
ncbi:MAG: N-acetylglucosamine-6-phosphate deacetylase [Lentisphaeria bacterium]|nr:N-acetylglucosamine-6-phosphate deacetylase [Lentisphaeria bacterium]